MTASASSHGVAAGTRVRVRDACVYCARRENLRRTVTIALLVGVVLTLINQEA